MTVLCQGVPMKSGPMGRLMTVHTEGQRWKDELNLNWTNVPDARSKRC